MANAIAHKSLKCIEWALQTSGTDTYVSETFPFQDMKCHLKFSLTEGEGLYSFLYFKRNKELQSVLKITVRVTVGDKIYNEVRSIIDDMECIWNNSCYIPFSCLITFEIIVHPGPSKDEKTTQTNLASSSQSQVEYLCSDFGELMESEAHSDVQLQCIDGNIRAHKAILAARSKWFAGKFGENNSESECALVSSFSSTEVSVMKLCLEFIYKGRISNLPTEMVSEIYSLGHFLKIPSLSNMCADIMVSNLSNDNYIDYLVLASNYDDDYFKSCIIDYISNHASMLKKRKIDEISK